MIRVVSESKPSVPGLDPEAPYSSRLSARSALYTELRLLLEGARRPLTSEEYRELAIEENRLSRTSSAARRKIWKELHSRYRLDARDPLFSAFWLEWRRAKCDRERGLTAYVLLALNDRLVADLGTDWLFGLLRRAPTDLRVDDVHAFLVRAKQQHPEAAHWSEETAIAVAQKYCASIRDFGLATGVSRKRTVRPALYGSPVRLLLRGLCLVGRPLASQLHARIFRLLAIDETEIIDALGELNRLGELRFRIQGDIIELDITEAA